MLCPFCLFVYPFKSHSVSLQNCLTLEQFGFETVWLWNSLASKQFGFETVWLWSSLASKLFGFEGWDKAENGSIDFRMIARKITMQEGTDKKLQLTNPLSSKGVKQLQSPTVLKYNTFYAKQILCQIVLRYHWHLGGGDTAETASVVSLRVRISQQIRIFTLKYFNPLIWDLL